MNTNHKNSFHHVINENQKDQESMTTTSNDREDVILNEIDDADSTTTSSLRPHPFSSTSTEQILQSSASQNVKIRMMNQHPMYHRSNAYQTTFFAY